MLPKLGVLKTWTRASATEYKGVWSITVLLGDLLNPFALMCMISQSMLQTRAELEEIAVVEADVARLKQKVAELHLQLSQQKQQQGGSLSDASDRHERVRNLQAQQ